MYANVYMQYLLPYIGHAIRLYTTSQYFRHDCYITTAATAPYRCWVEGVAVGRGLAWGTTIGHRLQTGRSWGKQKSMANSYSTCIPTPPPPPPPVCIACLILYMYSVYTTSISSSKCASYESRESHSTGNLSFGQTSPNNRL